MTAYIFFPENGLYDDCFGSAQEDLGPQRVIPPLIQRTNGGQSKLYCTYRRKTYPCVSSTEFNKGAGKAIARWTEKLGVTPVRKTALMPRKPECTACRRAICVYDMV